MKKIYLISMLLLSVCSLQAQPVFTNGDIFNASSSDSFKLGIFGDVYGTGMAMESATGTSYTWDFSVNINYMVGQFQYNCSTPVATAYSYFPPGSNLRESGGAASIENLFQVTADTVFMMRNGTSMSSGSFMVPKMRWLSFPLNFNETYTLKQLVYANVAQTIEGFTRTHTYKYDGFGTVKLPWGNVSNVFRIKMTTRDSSHIIAGYVTTYSNYIFFRQGGGMPVARLTSTCLADSVSHAYTLIANRTTAPTALTEIGSIAGLQVYPNPVQDKLFISKNNNLPMQVLITDMAGKSIITQQATGTLTEVSLNNLANGIYILTIRDMIGSIAGYQKLVVSR